MHVEGRSSVWHRHAYSFENNKVSGCRGCLERTDSLNVSLRRRTVPRTTPRQALDHLVSLLGRSRFREAPETVLRERWDGGAVAATARDEARYAAKRARREFAE